ncbi:hypothetical protein L596_014293 [Steinernema carpocapsae]|uniref:Uncharacterized protein n=1 Tax=Steinernema carpocapsae TaxID=34508 RepID=A0A4U5NBG3_STECR|nr:hypothetical protein L596_014293 [Steinernema carpocapsae]
MSFYKEKDYGIDYGHDEFSEISPYCAESVYGNDHYGNYSSYDVASVETPIGDLYPIPPTPMHFSSFSPAPVELPNYPVTRTLPKFYGETTNGNEFYWKEPALNESLRHRTLNPANVYNNQAPFFSETTNRSTYHPHQPLINRKHSIRHLLFHISQASCIMLFTAVSAPNPKFHSTARLQTKRPTRLKK